jgi:hypothetical protein
MSFDRIVASSELEGQRYSFQPPESGQYAWRVAAHDADGNYGEFGFARRIYLETEDPSDLLVSPRDGAKFTLGDEPLDIEFSWQSDGEAKSYVFVIGRGGDPLTQSIIKKETAKQSQIISTLDPGRYKWAVYAQRESVLVPIFLAPRVLVVSDLAPPKAHTDKLWDKK